MVCRHCEKREAKKYSKWTSGEFCSKKCARGFSTKENREEINKKVSKTLLKNYSTRKRREYFCNSCGDVCSKSCRYCSECLSKSYYRKLFEKLGIETNNYKKADDDAVEILCDLYFNKKLSLIEIRNEFGIMYNTVHFFLKKHGIELRDLSHSIREAIKNGKCINQPDHDDKAGYKRGWHITWFGKKVYLRSSYEFSVAKFFDDYEIHYLVEDLRLQYKHDNIDKTYIPDFYLPDENLIVETKNNYFIKKNKERLKCKKNVVKKFGYDFILLNDGYFSKTGELKRELLKETLSTKLNIPSLSR